MEHDQYLVRRSSLKFREQPEQWNIWKGSLVFPDGIFQQRFVFHFFKAIFDTLWWPASVTAKPKTSRQNQILHSKSKIALVLAWVFAFAMRNLVFAAVQYLILPWGLWFCREVFGFVVHELGILFLPWGLRFTFTANGKLQTQAENFSE